MLKIWFLALRPWSFTASFIPVALGTALAAGQGFFDAGLFALTLLAGIAMQAGTNLINTYGDYQSGVDTVEAAVTCPQLVTGLLTPPAVKRAGIACFGLASVIGLGLAWLRGWPIIIIGLIGLIGGYCYTAGFSYKYKGLGSIMVFFLMGPLMTWPAYFIQTAQYSWLPVLVSLPIGFLVADILHANDLRDMVFDRQAGIHTLALFLGRRKSLLLHHSLPAASFVWLTIMVAFSVLPWTAALPLILLPQALNGFLRSAPAAGNYRTARPQLEAAAAKFHFNFGLLLIAGLVINFWTRRWLG